MLVVFDKRNPISLLSDRYFLSIKFNILNMWKNEIKRLCLANLSCRKGLPALKISIKKNPGFYQSSSISFLAFVLNIHFGHMTYFLDVFIYLSGLKQ